MSGKSVYNASASVYNPVTGKTKKQKPSTPIFRDLPQTIGGIPTQGLSVMPVATSASSIPKIMPAGPTATLLSAASASSSGPKIMQPIAPPGRQKPTKATRPSGSSGGARPLTTSDIKKIMLPIAPPQKKGPVMPRRK